MKIKESVVKKVRIMAVAVGGLFLSVSAFAQYAVVNEGGYAEAAVNPGAALTGVTGRMSAVSDDYGKTASVLGSFYDNMEGYGNTGESAVYAGGESGGGGNPGNGDSVTFPKTGGGTIGPVPVPTDGEVVGGEKSSSIKPQGVWEIWEAVKCAKEAIDYTKEKMEYVADTCDKLGEKRALEGKEKQRAAEEKWEGKARNYPELNK